MRKSHQARQVRAWRATRLTALPIVLVVIALLLGTLALIGLAGCQDSADTSTSSLATESTVPSEDSATQSTASTAAEQSGFPVTVEDDTGTTVTVSKLPQRIVSTAPSNTEILFALGVGSRVVGVTSLCDYPPEAKSLPKVGDFQANPEAITALSPDLVVSYSGNEDALAQIQSSGVPVLIMNPQDIEAIYADIMTIGKAVGALEAAEKLVDQIKSSIESVAAKAAGATSKPRVFYALDTTLWTAGPGSFVDEMLKLANAENIGSSNVSGGVADQYYQLTAEQLVAADPDLILLPNTAFTSVEEFTKDARFASLRAVKEGKVVLIDDVIITRPGPRIAEGLRTLAAAVHPGLF